MNEWKKCFIKLAHRLHMSVAYKKRRVMNKCVKSQINVTNFVSEAFLGEAKKRLNSFQCKFIISFFGFPLCVSRPMLRKSLFVKYNCTYEKWPAIFLLCFLLNWSKRRLFVVADCFSEARECFKLLKGKARLFVKKY